MRRIEGCFCHGDIKTEEPNYQKRRKKMLEVTESELCCWGGKWAAVFAMDEGSRICDRVRGASSIRYKQAMLTVAPAVAAKVAAMADRVLSRWCIIIKGKTEYHLRIPHSVTCIFAQYLGQRLHTLKFNGDAN